MTTLAAKAIDGLYETCKQYVLVETYLDEIDLSDIDIHEDSAVEAKYYKYMNLSIMYAKAINTMIVLAYDEPDLSKEALDQLRVWVNS